MTAPTAKLPADAIELSSYAQLEGYLATFARGDLDLVLLIGRPGTGKSEAVKKALGLWDRHRSSAEDPSGQDAALYVEGHMGSFGLYRQLWAHRDRPVAIDDLDRLYSRSDCLRLLKPLCNSGPVKRITWYSNATRHSPDVPESFVTRSRVILIANEWHTLNDNVRALEDRAIILSFEPTNLAVHQRVGSWFDDQEVYRLIETILPVAPAVSMRHYVKARALKRAGIADWAMGTMQMVLADAHLAAVAWLVSDTSFDSEAARVERFTQLTGRSRPTYFRLKNRLRATG